MTIAAGPFIIAATLLALGGVMKVMKPLETANALRGLGIPAGSATVRIGGVAEAVIGLWALTTGDRPAAILVALSYLGFTVFVIVALVRRAPISSCGCFGKANTPPSRLHIGVNLVAFGAAAAVALEPGAGLFAVIADQPLAGVPFLVLAATGVFLSFLALTLLPRTLAPKPATWSS